MFRVIKNLNFCYGHRLLNYMGKCAHLHGHNAVAEVEFSSESLDSRGMVIDFEEIKATVQSFLDETLDHRMLLSKKDPFVVMLKNEGEPVFEMDENPTAENIAKLIHQFIKSKKLPISRVRVWESPSACAEYSEETAIPRKA
jgi:6-pyruvoyltetrahydropterin/6-carboxytetrahydropterin synthase